MPSLVFTLGLITDYPLFYNPWGLHSAWKVFPQNSSLFSDLLVRDFLRALALILCDYCDVYYFRCIVDSSGGCNWSSWMCTCGLENRSRDAARIQFCFLHFYFIFSLEAEAVVRVLVFGELCSLSACTWRVQYIKIGGSGEAHVQTSNFFLWWLVWVDSWLNISIIPLL